MANLLPSSALCAHVHDAVSGVLPELGPVCEDVVREQVRAFVGTIYESSRPIELCKEISQYVRATLANNDEQLHTSEYHHLAFANDRLTDHPLIPRLRGKGLQLIDTLCSLRRSPVRDKCLTVLTKLHALALPLKVPDARSKIIDMNENIMSPFEVDPEIIDNFQDYIDTYNFGSLYDNYVWTDHDNMHPLHYLSFENYGSTKKKPTLRHDGCLDVDTTIDDASSYNLQEILSHPAIRQIYLDNKEEFMTLVTGYPVNKVDNDEELLKREPWEGPQEWFPIGREGVRLQEAEKVRALWMPLVIFTCLCAPAVTLMEDLVKGSSHQTIFLNDREALFKMQRSLFRNNQPSADNIYSIDQTAFTDNFSYKFQRCLLQRFANDGKIPMTTLKAFDLQVLGNYKPMKSLKIDGLVHFAKGTPMGADGGFMLATLTHEMLIRWIHKQLNLPPKKFWVQGDDAVISGDNVFNMYDHLMTELGCEVNKSKTMRSNTTIEYCGYIATDQGSITPMYRPHDRLHDLPKDVISERAQEAFTYSAIERWIYEHRPEIIDQLQISGYLAIYDGDPNLKQKLIAMDIYQALVAYRQCVPSPITGEQLKRLTEPFLHYPHIEIDEDNVQGFHLNKDDRDNYILLTDLINWHYNKLVNDPNANLMREAKIISGIADIIMNDYRDHIPSPGIKKDKAREKVSRNPYKKDYQTNPDIKSINKALQLAGRLNNPTIQGGDESHDEFDIP